jgi:2,4-didehydro-3-deoxy-L-rhamnonate hydrolase
MKLISYADTQPRVGIVVDDAVVDLSNDFDSMLTLIEGGHEALAVAGERARSERPIAQLREIDLLAPIPTPRRNVFCVGWNYLRHFEEGVGRRENQEAELPEYPTFFTKPTTAVIGPGAPIPYDPDFSDRLDYEAEIAVIVGQAGRSIAPENTQRYIFGYTLANDVSARDIQRRHGGQWFKGKGMDGSCPLGPWILTVDEIADPQNLGIQCRVNGVLKQDASTRQMIFPIATLIHELSFGMTLLPGDIVLTGTPEGVGFARTPPEYLRPGDEVVVTSPEIGQLHNSVAAQILTREESPHAA